MRKLLGYRRFEGLAAARAIARLYGASRLFVNFFQPSFKLASKQRDGAKVTLLEEMQAVQAYLAALADGETPPPMVSDPPNLAAFAASLSSAWHMGEIRPTFSIDAKPRYLRGLEMIAAQAQIATPAAGYR